MGKVTNESYFLYEGFIPYVPKKKLKDYDNKFLSRKVYTVKFTRAFINEFVNLKYYSKRLKQPSVGYLFNFFLLDFSQRDSKTTKALKDFNDTAKTKDVKFMFPN